jgi:hypothetical protein
MNNSIIDNPKIMLLSEFIRECEERLGNKYNKIIYDIRNLIILDNDQIEYIKTLDDESKQNIMLEFRNITIILNQLLDSLE